MRIKHLLLAALLLAGITQAAQQHIDFGGPGPNDGDTAPVAFGKIEANTTELYGDIDLLTTDLSSLTSLVGTKQDSDADLTAIAGLTPSNDDILQRKTGAWVNRSLAQLKSDLAITAASLGLTIGTNVQAWDADLDTWATKSAPAGAVVGTSDTQTLTNKSISGGQITSAVANATAAVTATTATTLAANGTNCTVGEYARGVDAQGNAENCTTLATGGDASTNTSTSVDGEVAIFSGTGGKTLKRATGSGIAKVTSGVLGTATAGTDYYAPGGTDVALADGGTGSSTAAGARTNLGVAIGSNVQAWDADLDAYASTQNATTATALAANGTNCTAGAAAGGVDAEGNAEDCFTPSGGAPTTATYITQTPNGTLSNEQALSALSTGLLKNTTTTGVLSIGAEGTDYYAPSGTDVAVADGGTGSSTAGGARTNLGVAIGSNVQAWDADLDTWATKTAPAGAVVGTSDTQTLTNKSISGGQITSAVATATALAANGTNCSAGQYPLGVDASGNSETCTALAASATTDTTNASNISSGTLPAGRLPALTGDVTTSTGSAATTIAQGAVSDDKASLSVKPASTVVATTNQTLSGTPTIDGQATADGSIVLATAQSTGSQNGFWVVHAGAWTRPTWYASGSTTQAFQFITSLIRLGTVYQGTTWRQTAAAPITIDTTATTWAVAMRSLNTATVSGTLSPANGGLGADFSASSGFLKDTAGTITAVAPTTLAGFGITDAAKSVDVQEFTSSGTWTKPTGVKAVRVLVIGPGGGGGGGARLASGTSGSGGAGGGAGCRVESLLDPAQLGSTETVTVSAGGTAGAGATSDNTAGGNGNAPSGGSAFGPHIIAFYGGGGAGGQVNGTSGGGGSCGWLGNGSSATGTTGATGGNVASGGTGGSGVAGGSTVAYGAGGAGGGSPNGGTGTVGGIAIFGNAGGGSGGGVSTTPTAFSGATTTRGMGQYNTLAGGGTSGGNGSNAVCAAARGGVAGGGGGGRVGGNGGAAGTSCFGAGGSGGGAAVGGNGGAGSAGGDGYVIVLSYF